MPGVNDKLLTRWYLREKMSIAVIGEMICLSRSTVRKRLIDAGVALRSRAEGVRLAGPRCAVHLKGKKRPPRSRAWKLAISKSRQAWADKHARGICLHKGYPTYTRGPHKNRGVHIVVMEKRLGRRLRRDEQVHHVDRNKLNFHQDNLALLTKRGHARLHRFEDAIFGTQQRRGAVGKFIKGKKR